MKEMRKVNVIAFTAPFRKQKPSCSQMCSLCLWWDCETLARRKPKLFHFLHKRKEEVKGIKAFPGMKYFLIYCSRCKMHFIRKEKVKGEVNPYSLMNEVMKLKSKKEVI